MCEERRQRRGPVANSEGRSRAVDPRTAAMAYMPHQLFAASRILRKICYIGIFEEMHLAIQHLQSARFDYEEAPCDG